MADDDHGSPHPPNTPRTRKTYPLRLSHAMYEELRGWAEQEMRSVNGQIEFLLREALRKRKGSTTRDGPDKSDEQDDVGREPQD